MDAETFWSIYEEQLLPSGFHPKAVAWCRKRAAFFIETTKRATFKDKTLEDIKGYSPPAPSQGASTSLHS